MTDDRVSGLALIAGSCGMIITMSLHPKGHVASAQVESMIRMLIGVHALAIACVPVLFLGSLGLWQRVGARDRTAIAGVVLFGFALIAVMNAAVADGLVTPRILRQIIGSAGSQQVADNWRMVSHYNFFVNQGFAQVYVAASSAAIFAWSLAVWRNRTLARGLALYGLILAPVSFAALFSGHLNLDAHGFGAVIFTQTAWFVAAGVLLGREKKQAAASVA